MSREKMKVALVYGGRSAEHEVSLRSAESVFMAADKDKLDMIPVLVTKEGAWYLTPQDSRSFSTDLQVEEQDRIILSPDPGHGGFIKIGGSGPVERLDMDVVFPIIHGTFGEDGTLQGLLDMSGIPYVGCGALASAMGMDKVVMKSAFLQAGLEVGGYCWFLKSRWESDRGGVMQKIQNRNFPVFVKPANLGSSVGISKVENIEGIEDAVNRAAIFDRKILVEDGITGREIEISVLGNEEPVTSLAGEIVSRSEFYDYEEKYIKDTAELIMPAELSDDLLERARSIAISAYQAIDASGLARADMFITEDDRVLINELNTMPGFTSISMYPKLWELSGIPYKDLIQRLIDLAMERHDQRRAIKTDRSAP